jgi:hypothetical protein
MYYKPTFRRRKPIRRWAASGHSLTFFLVLAGFTSSCLEPLLTPLAPPLDFALSFRRHRYLFFDLIDARASARGGSA